MGEGRGEGDCDNIDLPIEGREIPQLSEKNESIDVYLGLSAEEHISKAFRRTK